VKELKGIKQIQCYNGLTLYYPGAYRKMLASPHRRLP